jgi:hypothetical protein
MLFCFALQAWPLLQSHTYICLIHTYVTYIHMSQAYICHKHTYVTYIHTYVTYIHTYVTNIHMSHVSKSLDSKARRSCDLITDLKGFEPTMAGSTAHCRLVLRNRSTHPPLATTGFRILRVGVDIFDCRIELHHNANMKLVISRICIVT